VVGAEVVVMWSMWWGSCGRWGGGQVDGVGVRWVRWRSGGEVEVDAIWGPKSRIFAKMAIFEGQNLVPRRQNRIDTDRPI